MSSTSRRCRGAIFATLAALAIVMPASPAWASPNATACEMQAVISLDPPGLTLTPQSFSYGVVGTLNSSLGTSVNGCFSSDSNAPSGTQSIDGGNSAIVRVSGTDPTTGPWSVDYAPPQATGFGSCAESQSSGTLIAFWPDGTNTVIGYSTVGAPSGWTLTGNVTPSATLNEVSSTGTPPAGTPTTDTISSNNPSFPVGENVTGHGTFISEIGDPTCSGTTFGGFEGSIQFTGT